MQTEMEIHGVNLDVSNSQPVVILKTLTEEKRYLPIWIGQFEATSIMMQLQGIKPFRPLTHDLLRSVMHSLDADLEKIVIDRLSNGTFYAKVHVSQEDRYLEIDSRPSDAIALAVRCGAPIFVEDEIISTASISHNDVFNEEDEEVARFKKFLDDVDADDFLDS